MDALRRPNGSRFRGNDNAGVVANHFRGSIAIATIAIASYAIMANIAIAQTEPRTADDCNCWCATIEHPGNGIDSSSDFIGYVPLADPDCPPPPYRTGAVTAVYTMARGCSNMYFAVWACTTDVQEVQISVPASTRNCLSRVLDILDENGNLIAKFDPAQGDPIDLPLSQPIPRCEIKIFRIRICNFALKAGAACRRCPLYLTVKINHSNPDDACELGMGVMFTGDGADVAEESKPVRFGKLHLSPNPTKQQIRIMSELKFQEADIHIQSIDGSKIFQTHVKSDSENSFSTNLLLESSGLASGQYILVVESGGERYGEMLVIYK